MPHIHTKQGQHDSTVSAWIFREVEGELRVLVHMHRRLGKLMQTGGHVELDETPWQTVAHELKEEAGYDLTELDVLQPNAVVPRIAGAAVHPVPVLANTHMVDSGHYHSDYCYAFMAKDEPLGKPAEGESNDLRWLTVDELYSAAKSGDALQDVAEIYDYISVHVIQKYYKVAASVFSVDKPRKSLLSSE